MSRQKLSISKSPGSAGPGPNSVACSRSTKTVSLASKSLSRNSSILYRLPHESDIQYPASVSISLVLLKKERRENSECAHNPLAAILLLPRYNREGLCGNDPRAQCISVYEMKKFVIYTPQSFGARHKKIVISM